MGTSPSHLLSTWEGATSARTTTQLVQVYASPVKQISLIQDNVRAPAWFLDAAFIGMC